MQAYLKSTLNLRAHQCRSHLPILLNSHLNLKNHKNFLKLIIILRFLYSYFSDLMIRTNNLDLHCSIDH